MNIYDLIKDYNDIMRGTLAEFTMTDSNDNLSRNRILARLEDQFSLFSEAKENSFYAELARFPEAETQINTLIDSNRKIIDLIDRLSTHAMDSREWPDDFRTLQQDMEQLFNYEESELFTVAQELLDTEEELELAEELASEHHVLEGNARIDAEAEQGHEKDYVAARKGEDHPGNTQLFRNKRQGVL